MRHVRFFVILIIGTAGVLFTSATPAAAVTPVASPSNVGYFVPPDAAVTTATTTFTFPTVTCAHDNDVELMLFGLFVGVPNGTTMSFATVLAQCDHQSQPMIEGYV